MLRKQGLQDNLGETMGYHGYICGENAEGQVVNTNMDVSNGFVNVNLV